jgi:anthranilate phosphoribosyltransferase
VYDGDLTEKVVGVLRTLGSERAAVVHGSDGLDEVTLTGPSRITELKEGEIASDEIHPEDLGLECVAADALKGGTVEENARILQEVVDGAPGPHRDVVTLNAAVAVATGGVVADLKEGLARAREALDSGGARQVLDDLKRVSNS